jgi:tetratricopeptide (TPR) repeat protein
MNSLAVEPQSSVAPLTRIEVELGRIRELTRERRYREAVAAAETLVVTEAGNRDVIYLIALNQRCLNRIPEALATLERLEQLHPHFSRLYEERGHCYLTMRDGTRAIEAFQRAVSINEVLPECWTLLERLYRSRGDDRSAAAAAGQVATLAKVPPEVVEAGSLFYDGDLEPAENILRAYLRKFGDHVEAMRLLGRIRQRRHALDDAEQLLKAVVGLAPHYGAARIDYISVLIDRQKYLLARAETDALLQLQPGNKEYLSLQAAACTGLGEHERAIRLYCELLGAAPDWSHHMQLLLGHSYKAIGRQQEAIECYRAAAAAQPSFGDAYWCLANLKTYRFSQDEIARMCAEENSSATHPVDRYHLCFALGKAFEDRTDYAKSWRYYELGNSLKCAQSRYRPQCIETNTRKQIEVCTAQFFAARAGVGTPDPDPIFIVGLPRSGSTLIEQILASHSQVEGTQELHDIERLSLELQGPRPDEHGRRYPNVLTELSPGEFRGLGERYIADTRAYRKDKANMGQPGTVRTKTARPFFTDKMPDNFRHIGLIHLMLPHAKIIDVRREPMACCFSNLKQLFANGQEFTYSIESVARYYRTYLDLMQHWDEVLPGRVLRVCYEDLVGNLEGNVRRILEFCGLEFEPRCLEFYKTGRSVSTASSEQVRRPISREGISQWRHYEPWLDPLKDALGDAVVRYRL